MEICFLLFIIFGILTMQLVGSQKTISKIIPDTALGKIVIHNDTITLSQYNASNNLEFMLSDGLSLVPLIRDETNSSQPIRLSLPKNTLLFDYQWLEAWKTNDERIASVLLDSNEFNIQLDPFKRVERYIRSGPILMVDEKTFFVTNFHFDGKAEDMRFWVGKNKHGTTDEENLITPDAPEYKGEDFYVELPNNLTIHDIEYFGVCSKSRHSYGYTRVPQLISRLPIHAASEMKLTIYVPKCCPKGHIKTNNGCKRASFDSVHQIEVFEKTSNANYQQIVNFSISHYVSAPMCRKKMYALDDSDEYYLLSNGIIDIKNLGGDIETITKDTYCLAYRPGDDGISMALFLCDVEVIVQLPMAFINFLTFLSICGLLLTITIFIYYKHTRVSRGVTVVGFTGIKLLWFLTTFTMELYPEKTCTILDPIYTFLFNSSLVWQLLLVFECYYRVRYYLESYNPNRLKWYFFISVIAPAIVFIINTASSDTYLITPNPPDEVCNMKLNQTTASNLVFAAILITAIFSAIAITWIKIKQVSRVDLFNAGDIAINMKKVMRSYSILLIITFSCWILEIFAGVFNDPKCDIVYSLINQSQGWIMFVVFILHNPVYSKLMKIFNRQMSTSTMPINV